MMRFLSIITALNLFKLVDIKFQIKGHTRNSVDRDFGVVKNALIRRNIYTPENFRDMINDDLETEKISAILLSDRNDFKFRKYGEYLDRFYCKNIKNITQYQMFRFCNLHKTDIFLKEDARELSFTRAKIVDDSSLNLLECFPIHLPFRRQD
jgi:hypothetical protein